MRERLEKLVKEDRLLIGPAYTQIDLMVSSGEEIVRNLLLGIQTARDFGKPMLHGYTADNFGFCAQMPQIYQGFDIPYASMYRGTEPGSPRIQIPVRMASAGWHIGHRWHSSRSLRVFNVHVAL